MEVTMNITDPRLKYLDFLALNKIKEEKREYVTQNQSFARFGRSNVERWVKQGKVKQFPRGEDGVIHTIEYRLSQLKEAAANEQDYL